MKTIGLSGMAWRNLWRNRRRTLLTLSSISFGVMLAIIFTGIQDQNFREMIDMAARLGAGHVTLQHADFYEKPTFGNSIDGLGELKARAKSEPEVTRVVTRISGQVMLASAGQSYGAGFIAFDPQAEDTSTLSIIEALAEGALFEDSDSKGIILGRRLADNLGAPIGRKVVFSLSDKNGEIVQEVARVSGIIETGAPTIDGALCLLPLGRLSGTLGYGADEATQLALFLRDQRRAGEVAARLGAALPKGVTALPWDALQPDLAAFIGMKVAGAIFMEVVIMILVAAGIFNTLFVSVMERIREFGIMLAIGFTPASIFALVMYESLWLGLVGLIAAAFLTAGPYYYLMNTGIDIAAQLGAEGAEVAGVAVTTVIRVGIYPENLLLIAVAAIVATMLSGIYPAWKAGRVAPVESIRLV